MKIIFEATKDAIQLIIFPEYKKSKKWFRDFMELHNFMHKDMWTGLRVVLAILTWFIPKEWAWLDFGLFLLGIYSDMVDGSLAFLFYKNCNKAWGDFWDGLCDKIFIGSYLAKWAIYSQMPFAFWIIFAFMFCAELLGYFCVAVKYLSQVGDEEVRENLFRHMNVGKFKFFFQSILGALVGINFYFSPVNMKLIYLILVLSFILTLFSVRNKFIDMRKCI